MADKAKADEVYVRLKDKSTSFHDISQGKGVVADRLAILKRTAKVSQALHAQVLQECTEAEYLAFLSRGEAPAKKAAAAVPDELDKVKATPAKRAAATPSKATDKKTASKKSDLTADEDDEDETT